MAKKQYPNTNPICQNKGCNTRMYAEGGAQYIPVYGTVRKTYLCTNKNCPDYLKIQLETQEPFKA